VNGHSLHLLAVSPVDKSSGLADPTAYSITNLTLLNLLQMYRILQEAVIVASAAKSTLTLPSSSSSSSFADSHFSENKFLAEDSRGI